MTADNPTAEYQDYQCGGGYTDDKGITWDFRGMFYMQKGATDKELKAALEKYCKYYPRLKKERL